MSAPTLKADSPLAGRSGGLGLRLRLKPADQARGYVQGAWWPRSTLIVSELPALLAALSLRWGRIDRVIYDENSWAPAPPSIGVDGSDVLLEGVSDQSFNTLSVIGAQFGRRVLLVVPPYTNPSHAYTIVMTAAGADDNSTPDELLGIGPHEAEDRRLALLAHQRWESEGGALRRRGLGFGAPAVPASRREVRGAQ
jgi:Family of unknown function (DUF5994)